MNKVIIAGAILAAGAGAVILSQQNSTPTYNVLDYIPADTPLFGAQFEPFPIKDYIASAPRIVNPEQLNSSDEYDDSAQPAAIFLLHLLKTYEISLTDADLFVKTFGLPDKVRAYFYTLGLSPVFKIEIANEKAIWDVLDKAELESGFSHKKGTLDNTPYRAYPITDETDPVNAEVIVAINNGLLTVTLNSTYHPKALLSNALGLTKAAESLTASGTVEEIIKQHNFMPDSIGFINHVEIIKGLTTTDGNQLAKQITELQQKSANDEALTQLRSEQCASELSTIAANWPRSVVGYTQLDITAKESTVAMSTVIESKNQVFIEALSALRGHIPKYVDDINNNVLAMAIGLDISELSNTLNTLWSDLQTPTYTCEPLADIQYQVSQSRDTIGMVGMSANMANGVQGISLGILDYAIGNIDSNPQLDSLDALFTISAESPEQLFNSAKMFLPELQQTQLTSGGEPVALNTILPIPGELNLDPQLAIKGNHLVIYNGEKGKKAADTLASEALAKKGLYNLSFDFKKMVTPMVTAVELSDETIPEEAMFLTEYDARMQMKLDVTPQGLSLSSMVNNKAPKE